jgi:amino acid transporter
MSKFTKTPVNTVLFDAFFSLLLGLLAFAGPQAINAVFAISVTALYVAYAIPIVARFVGDNDFQPGPFTLGVFVRTTLERTCRVLLMPHSRVCLSPLCPCCLCCSWA